MQYTEVILHSVSFSFIAFVSPGLPPRRWTGLSGRQNETQKPALWSSMASCFVPLSQTWPPDLPSDWTVRPGTRGPPGLIQMWTGLYHPTSAECTVIPGWWRVCHTRLDSSPAGGPPSLPPVITHQTHHQPVVLPDITHQPDSSPAGAPVHVDSEENKHRVTGLSSPRLAPTHLPSFPPPFLPSASPSQRPFPSPPLARLPSPRHPPKLGHVPPHATGPGRATVGVWASRTVAQAGARGRRHIPGSTAGTSRRWGSAPAEAEATLSESYRTPTLMLSLPAC